MLSKGDRIRPAPMHFVLCYPTLSAADGEAIEAFRRKHEPARAKMVRAHITLVFGVTGVSADAVTKLAASIAAKVAPFDFAIDHIEGHTNEGTHNLFLIVGKGRDQLVALNTVFHSGILAPERGNIEFSPHITIATNTDLKAVIEAAKEAKHLKSIEGRIANLDVVTLKAGVLTPIASLPLSG
jgi:2'-5' RNA ligase